MKNARQLTVEALCRVEDNKAWSSPALDSVLAPASLSGQDRGFATALFYGTLTRRYTIDSCLRPLLKTPLRKLDTTVRNILRIGIYQLLYMDSVPDHAAVNECVDLARKMKKSSAASLINAVLRGFLRTDKVIPAIKGGLQEQLALEYSITPQLAGLWVKSYGEKTTRSMLESTLNSPPAFLRVNTLKTTGESLITLLADEGITAEALPDYPHTLKLVGQGAVHQLKSYEDGLYHIQDLSSQIAATTLGAEENMRVLDCCAAPGGKTFIAAQDMKDTGEIIACDLYDHRLEELRRRSGLLGITNISTKTLDMSVYHQELGEFDRVLCDVPCSGYGAIRRRPEIKYQLPSEFSQLPELQYSILANAGKYCKKGGKLIYSTCTLFLEENNLLVEKFLKNHPDFSAVSLDFTDNGTIYIGQQEADGFFITLLERN